MKRILYIICSVLLLASCTKEDRNLMLVNQEEAIDRYISAQKNVRIARNGGSNRLVATEGRGADSLEVGDAIMQDISFPMAKVPFLQQTILRWHRSLTSR